MNQTEAFNYAVACGCEDPQATANYLIEQFPKGISEYTHEDFTDGDQPFKLPMLYNRDVLKQAQIIEKIAEQAKSVGITNYKTTLRNYMKATPSPFEVNIAADGSYFSAFPDQPLVLECGDKYICNDHGVQALSENGLYRPVCSQPIMPVEILKNLDTNTYKVRVAFRRNGKWISEIFERSVLSQKSKIVEALSERGIAVNSESARDLVIYFSDMERLNASRIPENACISRLGWREHGKERLFVPYTKEQLTFDGEPLFRKRYESIRENGNLEEWHTCIDENIMHNSAVVRIIFAASVASVLVKPLGCNNFITHIWGESGTGKTVLSMCAASIWGNPIVGEYISSFNTTAVGIEKNLGFLQNLPLILDELQIADEREIKKLVYLATEGTGRSRGTKSGGLQRLETWSNCTISTGERPITSMITDGGAHNRVIEIECKGNLFKDPHSVARCVSENYGVFGRGIIAYLSQPGKLEALREKYYTFFDELTYKFNITQKQAYAAALILTADYAITDCMFNTAALTAADIAPFLKSEREISANVRGYSYLCEYVGQHQANFGGGDSDKVAYEQYGIIEGDYAFVVKSRFDMICKEGGFDPVVLLHWLSDNGIAVRDKDNKRTIKKRVGGVSVRCVSLYLNYTENTTQSCELYPF